MIHLVTQLMRPRVNGLVATQDAVIVAAVLAAAVLVLGVGDVGADDSRVDFRRDIRPLLSRSCYACHGPDAKARKAKLRLDTREGLLDTRDSLHVVMPGSARGSELFARITSSDPDEHMPPTESGRLLSPEEIELIRRWIDQGAEYSDHWSFVKPLRPSLPEVRQGDWVRGSIDAFILARQEAAGLAPSREADRYALIRRLSLDLRGLPPSLAEVRAFAADKHPGSYERVVDRFLASPDFGERWARHWLDLARYADSAGYGSDPLRTIWRYRDWVIEAFNRNLDYEQFSIEQLAGDLLPEATTEQELATAFHRNTKTNTEGGTDDEEWRTEAVKDRVSTTMQVWMGLTMGCAQCHDHKYDPISQKEYYQFFAIFNQTSDRDRPDESPRIATPTALQRQDLADWRRRIAALEKKLTTPTEKLLAAQEIWEREVRAAQSEWTDLIVSPLEGILVDEGFLLVAPKAPSQLLLRTKVPAGTTALRVEVWPDEGATVAFELENLRVNLPPGDTKPSSGRYVRIELRGKQRMISLAEVEVLGGDGKNVARSGKAKQSSVGFNGPAKLAIDGKTTGIYTDGSVTHTAIENDPWWEVDLGEEREISEIRVWNRTDGKLQFRLDGFRVALLDASRNVVWEERKEKAPVREVSIELEGGQRRLQLHRASASSERGDFGASAAIDDDAGSGWSPEPSVGREVASFEIAGEPASGGEIAEWRVDPGKPTQRAALRFRLGATTRRPPQPELPRALAQAIATPREARTSSQSQALTAHYLTISDLLEPMRQEIAGLRKQIADYKPPMTPILVELADGKKRKTHFLVKGNFLSRGVEVEAGLPSHFDPHSLSEKLASKGGARKPARALDRLGMARWLMSPENPLSARVAVNRFWAQIFGRGIVETEEDFGSQGSPPTHPLLLDWLAVEFRESGYDIKGLLRMMVLSSTYRQEAKTLPIHRHEDPRNSLLTRGARYRLEAEIVRDQALAISGLLSHKLYGPSVYPPQPPDMWRAAFNGQRNWATSQGTDRYRRALYTFLRRTVPYPSLAAFDAPNRETCTLRRILTNTPLQAFVTLNDPAFVEMAQALGRRLVREGGASAESRVKYGLWLALCRPPQDAQVEMLVALYRSELAHFSERPAEAMQLATDSLGPLPAGMEPARLAAWTVVSNVLLNLDAVLTKG